MIPCECGGNLYRNQRGTLKRSGEEYQRFFCRTCGETKTFYRIPGGEWNLEKRSGGGVCDDQEFMEALERVRSKKPAVAGRKVKGNG